MNISWQQTRLLWPERWVPVSENWAWAFLPGSFPSLLWQFSIYQHLSRRYITFHSSVTSRHPPSTAPTRSSLMSPQISCQFLTSMKYLPFFRSISEISWNEFLTLKVFKVQFFLHLTWQDSRLKFYNLKEDTGLNALSPQAWSWNW